MSSSHNNSICASKMKKMNMTATVMKKATVRITVKARIQKTWRVLLGVTFSEHSTRPSRGAKMSMVQTHNIQRQIVNLPKAAIKIMVSRTITLQTITIILKIMIRLVIIIVIIVVTRNILNICEHSGGKVTLIIMMVTMVVMMILIAMVLIIMWCRISDRHLHRCNEVKWVRVAVIAVACSINLVKNRTR